MSVPPEQHTVGKMSYNSLSLQPCLSHCGQLHGLGVHSLCQHYKSTAITLKLFLCDSCRKEKDSGYQFIPSFLKNMIAIGKPSNPVSLGMKEEQLPLSSTNLWSEPTLKLSEDQSDQALTKKQQQHRKNDTGVATKPRGVDNSQLLLL